MRETKILNENGEVEKAGIVLVDVFNQVLLVNERDGSHELPKGHREAGETLRQTAVRETLEESGYLTGIERYLGSVGYISNYTSEPVRVHYYMGRPLEWLGVPESPAHWVAPHTAELLVKPQVLAFILRASESMVPQPPVSLSTVALAHAL